MADKLVSPTMMLRSIKRKNDREAPQVDNLGTTVSYGRHLSCQIW